MLTENFLLVFHQTCLNEKLLPRSRPNSAAVIWGFETFLKLKLLLKIYFKRVKHI